MNKKKEPPSNLNIQNDLNSLREKIKEKASKLQSGQKVTTSDSDMFTYGPPVSPREFIESPEFFDNKNKQIVYPWVTDCLCDIFKGENYAPIYNTAVIMAGKGSGKSYCAAMIDTYLWYWILSFKNFTAALSKMNPMIQLDPSTTIMLVGMAKTAKQARYVVFDNAKNFIYGTKAFRDRGWLPDPRITSELQYSVTDPTTGADYKKVIVVPGNSSETFALGYAVFGGVIDEACFFAERDNDPVKMIYSELNIRRQTRFKNLGIIVMISSANIDGDFVDSFEDVAATDKSVYFKRISTYDCQPKYAGEPRFELTIPHEKSDGTIEKLVIRPPISLKSEYDKDRDTALKDYDAIPCVAGKPFYTDFAMVLAKMNRDRSDPCPDLGLDKAEDPISAWTRLPASFRGVPGVLYRVHVDLAKGNMVKGHCGVGFAMCHKLTDPGTVFKIKLDLALRFKSPHNTDIKIQDVLDFILRLKNERGFDIDFVSFDEYQGQQSIQTINAWPSQGLARNIRADKLSVGYKEHSFLRSCINTGQFDFYDDQNFLYELKRLEDYGNEHIDHASGAFKDEADAVAGAVYSAGALEGAGAERIKPRVQTGITIGRNSVFPRGARGGPGIYRNANNVPRYRRNF